MSTSPISSDEVGPFGPAVDSFDRAVDRWFEPLRANEATDRMFHWASTLGDFSLIWHATGVTKVLLGQRPRGESVKLSIVMGLESLIVNQGIKRLFGRVRPARSTEQSARHVRQPITSSFPSGHASAAMTAAAVLGRRSGIAPVYYLVGAVVAASRIHVRMHHASDVVAGAATGVVLGELAKRVLDKVE